MMADEARPSGYEALARLLQGIGIAVDMRQREAIRDVLMTSGELPSDTLAAVIASVLARSARQQQRILEFLPRWLEAVPMAAAEPAHAERADALKPSKQRDRATVVQASVEIGRLFFAELKLTKPRTIGFVVVPALALGGAALWLIAQDEGEPRRCCERLGLFDLTPEDAVLLAGAIIATVPVGFLVLNLIDVIRRLYPPRRWESAPALS
jgi:hypothetical protein